MKFVPCQGIQPRDWIERSIYQDRGKFTFNGPLHGEVFFLWASTGDQRFREALDQYRAAWDAKDEELFKDATEIMIKEWKDRRHRSQNGLVWWVPFPKNTYRRMKT